MFRLRQEARTSLGCGIFAADVEFALRSFIGQVGQMERLSPGRWISVEFIAAAYVENKVRTNGSKGRSMTLRLAEIAERKADFLWYLGRLDLGMLWN